ncbi:MAG: exodeoxyribonuclease VII small subunit [Chromatiales bacterium]
MVKKAVQEEIPFEDALSELESLVETMEKGELSLEESLASFERGVALTRLCQQALKAAEQKIEILSANSSEAELEPFQGD